MVPVLSPVSRLFITAASGAILAGCAGQAPPGGGPKDTVPPAVIRTVPDSNATGVSPQAITIEFSKYVDHRSVEEAIFISPYPGELHYDWSGTEVTFSFKGKLRENTTYVVNVGTDVADLHEGNRMASSFTLAFSTGDSIDRGFISGRVFDAKPEGVMIFAYRLAGMLPDTLDPSHLKPDYITQTGRNGTFLLAHLGFGPYRVFAVRDEYRNYLYDREIDQIGVASGDIMLTAREPAANDIWYRLFKEDTTRPFVAGVRPLDRYRIAVRFSEQLDSAQFRKGTFSIVDTLSMRPVPLRLVYLDRLQGTIAGLFTRTALDSPAAYRLRVTAVADLAGNLIDENGRGETFEGTLAPDTVRPSVSVRDMKDSARSVALTPAMELFFSDPVRAFSLPAAIVLRDSSRRDVAIASRWTGPASLSITPGRPLATKAWYTLRLTMDSVSSLTGRTYRDSVFAFHFQTLDLRNTGSISGVVEDARHGRGGIFLTVSSTNLTPAEASTIRMDSPGPFALAELPEGKYMISAYRDSSASGAYAFGRPAPFRPSDRFTVYPDTLRVRARWGVEGVLVRFR